MTRVTVSNLLAARDRIKTVLVKEQQLRSQRNGYVIDHADNCQTFEWVLAERRAVLAEVNAIRAERGKSPIDERTLLHKAEWLASGHVDFTSKYALYAAELAIGEET